ncbi:helix-turn-helix transcriptional regulator [Lutimaribacter sp. EGI FJ00015]|uniref:Helix-turn-helix transcriptional regulator n=1 Tax=Lutimaribacter degradans TaxID=2945989 RepID=A0ACC5ZWT0_9RHOB|nr:helix-turn-helix transcriptional regulator [Lutimaribacter sp. EGI FJ00013]MCM2562560.1 helix-turn-helix transcriptional regulator [Lutimaribacter sp. EGI FJ00013]MCO0613717.1 helix-turn-helix transcriptional regulator [Lutimaribacter sp. EGI FJ00015]MCO0636800.1 helix-turn-helix transcriptional regulator [Lutimaribacter sp. EGI FJ00014]
MDELTHIAFDAAPIGLVLTEHRVIRAVNTTFAAMAGYDAAALTGQSFRIFYDSAAEFAQVRDIGLEVLARDGAYCDERMLRRADGTRVWCRFRARSLTPAEPLARTVLSFAPIDRTAQGPALTPRERDVLQYLSRGLTSKEIAQSLGLSPRTIEDVRARLLRKFDVPNAARLLARLGQSG